MKAISNLPSKDPQAMGKALREHFQGVRNKEYIKQSLDIHLYRGLITKEQHEQMFKEYDLRRGA